MCSYAAVNGRTAQRAFPRGLTEHTSAAANTARARARAASRSQHRARSTAPGVWTDVRSTGACCFPRLFSTAPASAAIDHVSKLCNILNPTRSTAPGLRVVPDFVSPAEHDQLAAQLSALSDAFSRKAASTDVTGRGKHRRPRLPSSVIHSSRDFIICFQSPHNWVRRDDSTNLVYR
jgi:hypothetical protein